MGGGAGVDSAPIGPETGLGVGPGAGLGDGGYQERPAQGASAEEGGGSGVEPGAGVGGGGYEERPVQSGFVQVMALVPAREAMGDKFPLNGTYFQINEVFLDHRSRLVSLLGRIVSGALCHEREICLVHISFCSREFVCFLSP